MSKERLDKILSNNGMGTRKTVRPLVWRGHVSVNGQVATNPDQKVDVETDVIEVDGKALLVRRNICIMMNMILVLHQYVSYKKNLIIKYF